MDLKKVFTNDLTRWEKELKKSCIKNKCELMKN